VYAKLSCRVDGAPAPEQRDPVIRFARKVLLERAGGDSRSRYATKRGSGAIWLLHHRRRAHEVGRVEVRHDFRDHGFNCLRNENGTIVVEPRAGVEVR
jgi:hypothetical protein